MKFYVFTGRFSILVPIHNTNKTINSEIIAASHLQNPQSVRQMQLSGKWNEVPKWSGVTVS